MLLRSSSTPVLGSLLQSFSAESPNNNSHHQSELHRHTPSSIHAKLSCSNGGNQEFRKSGFHASPSLVEMKGSGFRRAQSDGNLVGMADAAATSVDEFSFGKKSGRRNSCCTLEAIPSLSRSHLRTSFEDEDYDDEGSGDEGFELGNEYNRVRVENLVLEEVGSNNVNGDGSLGLQSGGKMYLAAGTGFGSWSVDFGSSGGDGSGGGGKGSVRSVDFDRDGGGGDGSVSMEEHYKRMLEVNPGDQLFLRNYAQFLYQIKGDVEAAEEYYSRAILADQEDGETLSQYAKIIWELHHDKERAANYFERAVRVSSESSHVHAAYARFLWDAEDEEDESEGNAAAASPAFLHRGFMASATAA